MFILDNFVSEYVIKRDKSMFLSDIGQHQDALTDKIHNKSFLIIGGAGSIGSSFIKAVLPFKPSKLVVVDINENGLTELTRDLRSSKGMYVPNEYITYPMDYASPVFEKMFKKNGGFDIVCNFSAHKHVRSEKDIYSVEALLRNNVLNAKGLLDLLTEYPPEQFFCVSTDKAANPVNIMGASKRIMEDLIFSYSDKFPVKTARFANVAFSNGSLPAGFLERIAKRQPISAPMDVKRYFVSLEESGQICMLACMLGRNREIFFPKLNESQMITFDDIATNLLRQQGYEIAQCSSDDEAIDRSSILQEEGRYYPVHYSRSDTSGEKAYEEFYTDDENVDMNRFKALGVVTDKPLCDRSKLDDLIDAMSAAFKRDDLAKSDIVGIISEYLPSFKHIEKGKSLDSKM